MSASVKSFKPSKIEIVSNSGTVYNITGSTPLFSYYESIDTPFIMGVLQIIDSGINLIKTMPIQGGEQVLIEFLVSKANGTNVTTDELIKFDFRLYKIYNRQFSDKAQIYNMALVPEEALLNEFVRVDNLLEGTPDEIVKNLLKDYWKVDEDRIFTEESKFKVRRYPARKTVSSLISSLQLQSISSKSTYSQKKSDSSDEEEKGDIPSSVSVSDASVTGTAGYLFFQNRNGFVFKSIDTICAVGQKGAFNGSDVIANYYSRESLDPSDPTNYFSIRKYKFIDEIDIIDKLRRGVYSTKMVFYNISTGDYEEISYKLSDTFDDMVKLGSQNKLPEYQIKRQSYPSRVMSMIIDHETWQMDDSPADPEQGGDPEISDNSKYLIAQGIARRNILETQKLEIIVPGNINLMVGEKIKIYLPNMSSQSKREKEPWDRESSGNYLISKLSHNFNMIESSGQQFETSLELIRDTYGMEEDPSKVT